jgi:hypothetical protein
VRIKQNPDHYAIPEVQTEQGRTLTAWEDWLKWFVEVSRMIP